MKITFKDGSVVERALSGEACHGYTARSIELTAEDLTTLNAWINDGRCVPYIGQLASRVNRITPISSQSMYDIHLRRVIHTIFNSVHDILVDVDDTDDVVLLHKAIDGYLDTLNERIDVVSAKRAGDIDFTAVAPTVKGIVKDVVLTVQLKTARETVAVRISKVSSAPFITRTRNTTDGT